MTTIAVKRNLEDAAEVELEIGEETQMRVSDIVDAFADEEAISDDSIEGYIKDCIDEDFREKIGPVIDADHLTEMVAAVRVALEKARTT
jgi:hypothetical protein